METHRDFFKQFVQFINTADENLAQQLISPVAKFHVPGQLEPLQGPKGYLMIISMMRSGFPDIQWTLEDLITEGDKVAARFTMRGTHNGEFFGRGELAGLFLIVFVTILFAGPGRLSLDRFVVK